MAISKWSLDQTGRSGGAQLGWSAASATPGFQPVVVEVFFAETGFFFPGTERYLTNSMNKARKDNNKRYSKPLVSNMFTYV